MNAVQELAKLHQREEVRDYSLDRGLLNQSPDDQGGYRTLPDQEKKGYKTIIQDYDQGLQILDKPYAWWLLSLHLPSGPLVRSPDIEVNGYCLTLIDPDMDIDADELERMGRAWDYQLYDFLERATSSRSQSGVRFKHAENDRISRISLGGHTRRPADYRALRQKAV